MRDQARQVETLEEIATRLATSENRRFAIDGLLPEMGLGVLYGKPGSGKSFVATDLAVRMATGHKWCELALDPGAVVYIAAEDPDGIDERLLACVDALDEECQHVPVVVVRHPPSVQDPGYVSQVTHQVRAGLKNFPTVPPSLVIVDNLSAAFGALEQEGSGAMANAMRTLRELGERLNCAVLVIHHPPRVQEDVPAGGAPIERAPDLIVHLTRDARTGEIVLTATKVRAGPKGGQIRMRPKLHSLKLGDQGRLIDTLVLDDHRYLPPEEASARDVRESEARRAAALEEVAEAPDGLSTSEVLARLMGRGLGADKRTIQRELSNLAQSGELKRIGGGRKTRYVLPVLRQSSRQSRHSPPLRGG